MAKKKATKKLPENICSIGDEVGNLLVCKNNGARIVLILKLRAEARHRRIGVVNLGRKTLEVKRKREKHLFRKGNAYGFNSKLLEDAKLFDKVRLKDDFSEWVIPKAFILQSGSYLYFKNPQGFEKQIFVSLEQIEQFKRVPKV